MKGLIWLSGFALLVGSGLLAEPGVRPQPDPTCSPAAWSTRPPISFIYDGRRSIDFLLDWTFTQDTAPSEGGETHRYTYRDPKTRLVVEADVRTFADFPAVEWVVHFSNEGALDSPILEEIEPLHTAMATDGDASVHHARGSTAQAEDFEPMTEPLCPGVKVTLASEKGLSSSGESLPFFNLQLGGRGVIGAVGWTGHWQASFLREKTNHEVVITAGMPRTHLRLHRGESIRTPRILLLNWEGRDWQDAQNQWRQMVLAYYAPHVRGQPVAGPIMFGGWGSETSDHKIALIKLVHDHRLPFNVYATDAGWYGHTVGLANEEESNDSPSPWWKNRGDWWPDKLYYPAGLKPLGDVLKRDGIAFSLWVEPETAQPGTQILVQHPDWFLHVPAAQNGGAALLNLGNPEARRGITDIVSQIIKEGQLGWYRQDFNIVPEKYWSLADRADRVGMTEIRHIEGLYAFWDDLRARHPGLQIDNCASGGRRLDLEMISRSFVIWRSDFGSSNAIVEQMQTQAMAPWVPLNLALETVHLSKPWKGAGPFGTASQLYAFRAGYSAAFAAGAGPRDSQNEAWFNWLRLALAEYREVQPFFYGDFYPLLAYTLKPEAWTAWQWDRPKERRGLVVVLRRPESPLVSVTLDLHGLVPGASYEVEFRRDLVTGVVQRMTGMELARLSVAVPKRPGSLLVFYHSL